MHELAASLAHVGVEKPFKVSEVLAPLLELKVLVTRRPVASTALGVRELDDENRVSIDAMLYPNRLLVNHFNV